MNVNAVARYQNPFDYIKELDRFLIGGSDLWDRVARYKDYNVSGFPPYNIHKVTENKYTVELAVAGFSPNNIDITVEDGKLVVKGSITEEESEQKSFLYKGIATRNFVRTFVLDEHLEVKDADMENGMLKITIERVIPPEKLPKKIAIGQVSKTDPQLLVENKDI